MIRLQRDDGKLIEVDPWAVLMVEPVGDGKLSSVVWLDPQLSRTVLHPSVDVADMVKYAKENPEDV